MFEEAVEAVQPEVVPDKTILAAVAFGDLLPQGHRFQTAIDGSPLDVAAAIDAHRQAGVTHLQLHVAPNTDEANARVEAALAEWRNSI